MGSLHRTPLLLTQTRETCLDSTLDGYLLAKSKANETGNTVRTASASSASLSAGRKTRVDIHSPI
jgi:hypothetical protein